METHQCDLEENGVKLALTVVDTPGYGDSVDNTYVITWGVSVECVMCRDCWVPILEYIEDQFDSFLEAETRVERVQVHSSPSFYFHRPHPRLRTRGSMLASTSLHPLGMASSRWTWSS